MSDGLDQFLDAGSRDHGPDGCARDRTPWRVATRDEKLDEAGDRLLAAQNALIAHEAVMVPWLDKFYGFAPAWRAAEIGVHRVREEVGLSRHFSFGSPPTEPKDTSDGMIALIVPDLVGTTIIDLFAVLPNTTMFETLVRRGVSVGLGLLEARRAAHAREPVAIVPTVVEWLNSWTHAGSIFRGASCCWIHDWDSWWVAEILDAVPEIIVPDDIVAETMLAMLRTRRRAAMPPPLPKIKVAA